MKTLTICLLIVFVSIFGLNATSKVSERQARNDGEFQIVTAEKQIGFATETNLASKNLHIDEELFSEEGKYIPSQFEFLKAENDQLLFTIIFDVLLNNKTD